MLPRPEIESLERQSLENSHVSFRHLDALHEQVKAWPDGYEKDLELANISLLKERIGKEVFSGWKDL